MTIRATGRHRYAPEMTERIVAAAVYHGATISLPPPARHGQVMHAIVVTLGLPSPPICNQGFLTSKGRYVGRVEAKLIARHAGQIIQESAGPGHPELFSEDLW